MKSRLLGIGAGAAVALSTSLYADAQPEKPNILFVMVDDLAPDAVFSDRFPFLKTPNVDRLAEEGAVFDNFLVTTSLCSPSRASILTGTYAHRHGVRYNEVSDPDPSLPQFPQVLQEHGYVTAMIGKWHMARHAEPRDGFDYWLSFEGQGVYTDPELNEDGRVCRVEGYITDILTDKTIEFLKAETDRPFSILLWHKANHAPFEPAPRHADAFPDAEIDEAVSRSLDFSGKPRWQRRERIYGPHYRHWIASEGKPIPDRLDPPPPWHARNHVILNMLRCMLAVDEGGNHIHRTGAVKGADGEDLFEPIQMELSGQLLHAAGFHLEYPHCPPLIQNLVGGAVVEGKIDPVDLHTVIFLDLIDAHFDAGQSLQPQKVHFEHAHLLDGLH